jgi:hypothetical protein
MKKVLRLMALSTAVTVCLSAALGSQTGPKASEPFSPIVRQINVMADELNAATSTENELDTTEFRTRILGVQQVLRTLRLQIASVNPKPSLAQLAKALDSAIVVLQKHCDARVRAQSDIVAILISFKMWKDAWADEVRHDMMREPSGTEELHAFGDFRDARDQGRRSARDLNLTYSELPAQVKNANLIIKAQGIHDTLAFSSIMDASSNLTLQLWLKIDEINVDSVRNAFFQMLMK